MSKTKKLYLSSKDKMLAGVCGGIAEYLGVDSTLIRLGFILVVICTGLFPGVLAYIIGAVVIPKKA